MSPADDRTRGELDLRGLFRTLGRHRRLIAISIALCTGLAGLYGLFSPRKYTATSSFIIDSRRPFILQEQVVQSNVVDNAQIESQIQVLQSERIVKRVIERTGLGDDPEFLREPEGPFSTLFAALFHEAPEGRSSASGDGGLLGWFTRSSENAEESGAFNRERALVGKLLRNVTPSRARLTYVINISYSSSDPDRAAKIANGFAEAYLDDQLDAKFDAARRAGSWMQARIDELRQRVREGEQRIADFKEQNNLISSGGQLMIERRLTETNTQLVLAQTQRAEAQARASRIRSMLSSQDNNAANNVTVSGEYEIAQRREQSLAEELSQLKAAAAAAERSLITLREMEREVNASRVVYEQFLNRYREAAQQASFPVSEARIITEASKPLWPSHPNRKLFLVIGFAVGLFAGVSTALVLELLDNRFRSGLDVEEAGIDFIGMLPTVATGKLAGAKLPFHFRRADAKSDAGRNLLPGSLGIYQYATTHPLSRFTETIRNMKLSAEMARPGGPGGVISVVSALTGEGKSTVAMNLAQYLAQCGKKTVFLDSDLRDPSVSRALTPEAKHDLLDLLAGRAELQDVVYIDRFTGLRFVPGRDGASSHSGEVLGSADMANLVARLRKEFDYVILDLPALLPFVDARAAVNLVDSFVLVVQYQRTPKEKVVSALRLRTEVTRKMIGAVLNKVSELSAAGEDKDGVQPEGNVKEVA